ncbi:MAG: HlyD family efflux transporter periplasmic adaptor subunit [Rhizomicrobium sp.]|jgi:membrane fusion protein (multidrug efflux system)
MKYPGSETLRQTSTRQRLLFILAAVVILALAIWGLYWFFDARFYESTDDAYIGGNVVSITSRENGTVLALHTDNTQMVHRGQLLVELDPTTPLVNLQAAEADLARAIRNVRSEFSKVDALRPQVAAARVQLAQAQADYRRRAASAADGAVSAEEVSHARDAVAAAQAGLSAAQGSLSQGLAAVEGANVASNPDVLAAMAKLRSAAIVYGHMKLIAPVNGVVAQRSVQLGQQIAAGTPLMAVVPLDDLWVDANFKEGQLADMRVGQPVTVTADLYGGDVTYHGKIEGLGAGSGSAFALLPPQNASGNWIKIVQRVPVRIALDPVELRKHPLRIGLSATVSVDVRDLSGSTIGSAAPTQPMRADVDDAGKQLGDRLIAQILAQSGAAK